MRNELSREFFLGFIKIHILYHAEEETVCGVDMMKELARHGYSVGPGTLYPVLHRMEKRGYLRGTERLENGRRRIYYSATKKGSTALVGAKTKIRELVSEVM